MSSTGWIFLILMLVITTMANGIWIVRKYETHRIRRFFGFGLGDPPGFGRFFWKEGVFESEVTEAMSIRHAQRYGWLLSHRNQRLFVLLNVASWLLYLIGALDVPWNLGFTGSPFSWWALSVMISFVLLRQSIRVLADAPDDLIDERLVSIRDASYRSAYQIIGWVLPFALGFTFGVLESAETPLNFESFLYGLFLFGFIYESMPSMVIAWRGSVRDTN